MEATNTIGGMEYTDDMIERVRGSALYGSSILSKSGENAAGMTAAYDKSHAESLEWVRKELFANDPDGFVRYKQNTAKRDMELRENIKRYEIQQVSAWASKEPERKIRRNLEQFSEVASLELGVLANSIAGAQRNDIDALLGKRKSLTTKFENGELVHKNVIDKGGELIETTGSPYTQEEYNAALADIDNKISVCENGDPYIQQRSDGYAAVLNKLEALKNNMYKMCYFDRKAIYASDEDANDYAIAKVGGSMKAVIEGLAKAGHEDFSKYATDYYGREGAWIKKTGDSFKVDVLGRGCMDFDSINDIRKTLDSIYASRANNEKMRAQEAKAMATEIENKEMLLCSTPYTLGLNVLNSPDNTYDTAELKKYTDELSRIALTTSNHKVADHANTLLSQLTTRASTMTRRQKNWDDHDSKFKTAQDYYEAIAALDRAGNIQSIVGKMRDGRPVIARNVDIWQRKISLVKNGMTRGKIPQEQGNKLLKEYKDNFCKDNWEEASQYLGKFEGKIAGGTLSVDKEASWNKYVANKYTKDGQNAKKNYKHAAEAEGYKGDYGAAMNALFGGANSWENGNLKNAKYYMYKYTYADGKSISLTGDDVQALADGVKVFQLRNTNPTSDDVDKMLGSIFNKIVTNRLIKFGDNKGATYSLMDSSYTALADEYIENYYTKGKNTTQRDFDRFLEQTKGADFSAMIQQ